ncbi:MAG TPA: EamA family transporter, partial [Candidatus Thermoplasmatota archaeon]|nr:EamA family transporter [Candidatus Thermoplasmatota archaeon]
KARLPVLLAFAVVYLVWGSTYLAIHDAVATIPPFLMAGLRFLVAGGLLYAWTLARGEGSPPRAAWPRALWLGLLMLASGNGFLSLAETRMPTGVAALLIATVPMWVVTLEWALERKAPGRKVLAGLGTGVAGVAILSGTTDGWKGGISPLYVALVLLGSATWAWGSLLSRRPAAGAAVSLAQSTALQMLGGGAILVLWSLLRGETAGWQPAAVSLRSVLSLLYLSLFGSILALTCYLWLLRTVPPALASTYAFVNPIVAVLAGTWLLGEPVTPRLVAASALIVAAVALIVHAKAAGAFQRDG